MKINRWTYTLGSLLLLAALGIAGITAAKQIRNQNFGLTYMNAKGLLNKTDCDVNHTFRYVATWKPHPAGAKSDLYPYKCAPAGPISCNAAGQCSAQVRGCVAGPAWVQVNVTPAGSPDILQQRIGVGWPTNANGQKEVCP